MKIRNAITELSLRGNEFSLTTQDAKASFSVVLYIGWNDKVDVAHINMLNNIGGTTQGSFPTIACKAREERMQVSLLLYYI